MSEWFDQIAATGAGAGYWDALGQATMLFLATFVLEDAAALGAGLLLGTEGVSWPVAFWSCFLGIWMGDAGLYALARGLGRPWFERSRFARHAAKVAKSEAWFARRGVGLLLMCRMVPGSRLPTYLAAGFLRVPLPKFLVVTGLAALVWTALVLALSRHFGAWLQDYFHLSTAGMLWIVGGTVVALLALGLSRQVPWGEKARNLRTSVDRLKHWEFWPPWMFYPPVLFYCLRLAVRYRGLSLPAVANPGIFTGGLVGESKMATLDQLMRTSPAFTATATLIEGVSGDDRIASMRAATTRHGMEPPFILKPDLGQRGAGVKVIRSWAQAEAYLAETRAPMLVQRYAPGPFEVGVFYYRFPGEARGRIFSVTEKCFPELTGDGVSTLEQLIDRDPRARLMRTTYLRRFAARRHEVLPTGERWRLVEAGNHAQGCIFRDGHHLVTAELERTIDDIAQKLDRFHVGRFDIRYSDPEAFARGERFEIVELNGAAAEATSIYDARNSLWTAYQTLFRQWDLVFAIGAANHRAGHRGESCLGVLRQWWRYRKLSADYAAAD